MNENVTYKDLFEKYARQVQQRNITAAVMGTIGVIGVVLAVRNLRELQRDRQAVLLSAVRRQARATAGLREGPRR
jgi:hypothetical protein